METPAKKPLSLGEAVQGVLRRGHASTVMVITTILEDGLAEALKARMVGLPKSVEDRLFKGYGPLNMIAAKIDLARALGIINDDCYYRLRTLNKIRVEVAHARQEVNLYQLNDLMCKLAGRKIADNEDFQNVFIDCGKSIAKEIEADAASASVPTIESTQTQTESLSPPSSS